MCAKVKQQIENLEWLVETIRRERCPDFFQTLHDAIRRMHGCESRHLSAFVVRKVCGGEVRWLGMVEEFALDGVAEAATCYAWQYQENGQPRTFTVLRQGPVDSPQAAVQLFLLARDAPLAANVLA